MHDDSAPEVEFRAVRVAFDGEPVLEGVDLRVPAGRTTVLLGPSGAGKTTLVRTLLGLYSPESGRVEVDGREIASLDRGELNAQRRAMGVLLGGSSVSEPSLFGSMSIVENVRSPLRTAGIPAPEADAAAWQLLREFDLVERADALPSEVSAGGRRRAALARALAGEPRLLVLDDPGPALDLHNRSAVTETLRQHIERRRATALVVTHDLELARALGDRVAMLLGGRIVAAGPVDEVLSGVDDPEQLDARFAIRDQVPVSTPEERADAVRRAGRQGLGMAWTLAILVFVVLGLLIGVLATGILDNPVL